MLRARAVPTWLGVLLLLGAVAAMVPAPEPVRLLAVAVAVSLTGVRLGAGTWAGVLQG